MCNVLISDSPQLIVAVLTVVERAVAVVNGNRAAKVALPVDLGNSVNLAGGLANAVRLLNWQCLQRSFSFVVLSSAPIC